MSAKEVTIGGLDCIEVPGDAEIGTVVLLHGYGSTNTDLAPLSRVSSKMRWIFPAGPKKIVFGPDYTGYAWFDADVMAIREAVANKNFDKVSQAFSADLGAASKKLETFLEALGTPPEKLVLGGFSQGAVMATDCALNMDKQIKALVILSGTLTHEKEWQAATAKRAGLPFFLSHGKHDDVLPIELAERLEKLLVDGGLKGKLSAFNAGHEVPFSLLLELQPFLENLY